MELKVTKGRADKLSLSPHQVAWLTRHSSGNCFIIVRDSSLDISIYHGSDAVDLRMDGMSTVQALGVFKEPYNWKAFFNLTCPI